MNRRGLVNLLIGLVIALLPIYNRVAAMDFNRTSKDNLLVVLFGTLCFLMPESIRKINKCMVACLLYGLFFLVFNQWNVLSINVIIQTFYISAGILFFANFYEKHDASTTHFILNGMMIGALIQSALSIPAYFGVEIYAKFAAIFSTFNNSVNPGHGSGNMIGSLGNNNLLASYLALTSLAFLKAKNKWLMVIPVTALFLTNSMMGISSFIAGVFYYINLNLNIFKKWHIYTSSIVGMVGVYFTGLNGADSQRFHGWHKLFSLVTIKHFVIGMGPGWFPDTRITLPGGGYLAQEHNAFLSVFNVYGMIGVALLVPIFYKFITSKDENKIFSSILFVAWCNSYGHFTLHQSTVAIIIIVAACICLAEGKNNVVNLER